MAGHSHWAQIKRKKAAQDAKRGQLFTKLIREIIVAVRTGGSGDPELNPRLRAAIQAARSANMPKENIERAIKKALGLEEGTQYEEATFEGYGPGGVAILINTITDNRRRTVSELRHLFGKYGGNLAEPGAVAWIFEQKGLIVVPKKDEEKVLEIAIEKGAEDTKEYESEIEVITDPSQFEEIKKALENAGIEIISAKVTMVPKTTVPVEDEATANSILKFMEALEELDDVQQVYANFDIPEKIMENLNK
ncbi:MAG: YebC/PmpR family DNA-binding transcriptional regulator [Thermodesulfobacteriota bacterium]|nr:YebC/PmpR family DNA-binding transcriptional regulator [Thermodesulfobacteriota bacterium]MCU4138198.1 Transcriptional and/or translational regulatory protein YebC/TACO1 [Thermodesulfobacteriota bacterium]RKX61937.1 MAG: YebC/PmpR family DNA-binding transcriptional regulator [Thermodesulfobacteriota bacterium]